MTSQPKFILPDRSIMEQATGDTHSYAIINYYGKSPIASAKRNRFVQALALGNKVNADRVIDLGCADGLLLPSLSERYSHVAALDHNRLAVTHAQRLIDALSLSNVNLRCNEGVSWDEVREQIGTGYQLMFLLETVEHVGSQPDIWTSKIAFLQECFSLLEPGGQIVISVPKMVGLIMLFKNLLQRSLRLGHDHMTYGQLFRSALLKDTDALEPLWNGHHVGFNHLKLDRYLAEAFVIHDRVESAISVFYRIGRPAGNAV